MFFALHTNILQTDNLHYHNRADEEDDGIDLGNFRRNTRSTSKNAAKASKATASKPKAKKPPPVTNKTSARSANNNNNNKSSIALTSIAGGKRDSSDGEDERKEAMESPGDVVSDDEGDLI